MKKFVFVIVLSVLATPMSFAQQALDADLVNKIVVPLQSQRNQALDALAIREAQITQLTEKLTASEKRVKELEDKYEPKPDPKPKK